jgi:hypothetical protein
MIRSTNFFLDTLTKLWMKLPQSTTTNLEAKISRGLTIFFNNHSKKYLKKNNLAI